MDSLETSLAYFSERVVISRDLSISLFLTAKPLFKLKKICKIVTASWLYRYAIVFPKYIVFLFLCFCLWSLAGCLCHCFCPLSVALSLSQPLFLFLFIPVSACLCLYLCLCLCLPFCISLFLSPFQCLIHAQKQYTRCVCLSVCIWAVCVPGHFPKHGSASFHLTLTFFFLYH